MEINKSIVCILYVYYNMTTTEGREEKTSLYQISVGASAYAFSSQGSRLSPYT